MKNTKKLIALVMALVLAISLGVVATTASAESTTSVSPYDPMFRMWHYGGYPDVTDYTTGGYVTLEQSSKFAQQHQVCFYGKPYNDEWKAMFKESLKEDGIIAMNIFVNDCYGTNVNANTEDGSGYEKTPPQINVIVRYKAKTKSGVEFEDDLINEEKWGKIGENTQVIFQVDEEVFDYDSFDITFVKVAVMNYANNANDAGEQGCGNFSVTFSPFFIEGTQPPEMGRSLGEFFDESLYQWESEDKVTSDDQGNLTPDGPKMGGVDLKRNANYYPYLTNGKVATKNSPADQDKVTTTAKPACAHAITTSKVTKAATYFATGTKTTYCALCGKAIKTSTIAKKVLAKPALTAKAQTKAVKLTWKKVTGATGYVVEMKVGKKYKVVKTITKGATVTYTQNKLKKNTKYSFRVKAMVKSGSKKAYSAYSAVKTAKAK